LAHASRYVNKASTINSHWSKFEIRNSKFDYVSRFNAAPHTASVCYGGSLSTEFVSRTASIR